MLLAAVDFDGMLGMNYGHRFFRKSRLCGGVEIRPVSSADVPRDTLSPAVAIFDTR
jgi:hypothetical protein